MANVKEITLDNRYEVKFDTCGAFKAGDVVTGQELSRDEKGLKYLVEVGAVVLTDKKARVADAKSLNLQIEEAVAVYKSKIADMEVTITGLQDANDTLSREKQELLEKLESIQNAKPGSEDEDPFAGLGATGG